MAGDGIVFARRRKQSLARRLRNLLWPGIGLKRSVRYWMHRLARLPGTPRSIALGVAIGAAVCFTPLVGLQWGLALGLSWMFRASLVGATVGTLVANPWTYPLIWVALYQIGRWMIGGEGPEDLTDMSLRYLVEHPWDVLLPMLAGSLPLAPIAGIAIYYPTRGLVRRHQRRRLQARRRRPGVASASGR